MHDRRKRVAAWQEARRKNKHDGGDAPAAVNTWSLDDDMDSDEERPPKPASPGTLQGMFDQVMSERHITK